MITVIGSINLDLIAYCKNLPQKGETIAGDRFVTAAGGKGANQALAAFRASKAIGEVKFIGAVGNDNFATLALSELQKDKIDLSGIKTIEGTTGIANIMVDENGDNIIAVIAGANAKIDENMALAGLKNMTKGDVLLLNQEIPARVIKAVLLQAKAANIITILNIAPFIKQTKELAHLADIIIANESEINSLLGNKINPNGLGETIKTLAKEGNKIIIVTLGEKGAILASPKTYQSFAAPKITPIDTVGAGDSFCGYFAAMLNNDATIEQAIEEAVIAGALATLKNGAQTSIPYKNEVKSFKQR